MSTAKKRHRPNWDDASFPMRTDVEHEKKPRQSTSIVLPEVKLDIPRAIRAWRAIGVFSNDSESIRKN